MQRPRVWEAPGHTRKEIPLVGPGWQRCGWFEARLRIQGCRVRCRIGWVLKGAAEQGKAGRAQS